MMNRKEFYEYVKDNVKDYLPDSYQNGEIRIEEVVLVYSYGHGRLNNL